MPEAFTYFDMQRRLERAIPDEEIFKLEIFERGAGYIALDDTSEDDQFLEKKIGVPN